MTEDQEIRAKSLETDPVTKEFRLKALEASLEIIKYSLPGNDTPAGRLKRIVQDAIVIEHYLASGSLLDDGRK